MFGLRRLHGTKQYLLLIVIAVNFFGLLFNIALYMRDKPDYGLEHIKGGYKTGVEYLKKVDYKTYINGLPFASKPEVAAANLLSYLQLDGRLNESFFRTFRHHQDGISSTFKSAQNQEYYDSIMEHEISEPKVQGLKRNHSEYVRVNATLLSLVRNSELDEIVKSIVQIEDQFNNKFHYDWTFLNNEKFSQKFKDTVKLKILGNINFITIPPHFWDKPDSIDLEKEKQGIEYMEDHGVGYAAMASYHNMCRFYSGNIYQLPEMAGYRYYWRVEPSTKYYCEIDYDVFLFMHDNKKSYGFNLNLYEGPHGIVSLWNTTIEFLKENPQYLNANGAFDWLREDMQRPEIASVAGYSTCHFWTNFEIVDMEFFRGEAYTKYFEYLDRSGGFYYERWGDAPIRAIALGLFEDKSKIHWFRDIGYSHMPYNHCPKSDKCKGCPAGKFVEWAHLNSENCMANWLKYGTDGDEKTMWGDVL